MAGVNQIESNYRSIEPILQDVAEKLEIQLTEIFDGMLHIDRISSRVKSDRSFIDKTQKRIGTALKYKEPMKEIQDLIGARVVVYYKTDIENAVKKIKEFYQSVEETRIIPEDVRQFGYEGQHLVCFIPSTILPKANADPLLPDFFEIQIKTLYQHAWSQANHGLGYKPGSELSYDEERKLAFIAAQSWGADRMLSDLIHGNTSTNGSV